MTLTSIDKAGVYLLRDPLLVTCDLGPRLLIVFSVPHPKITGALIFNPDSPTGELVTMLDILYVRFVDELLVDPEEIGVKAFGLVEPSTEIMNCVSAWVARRRLRFLATDTGNYLERTCLIESATGKVGVARSLSASRSEPEPQALPSPFFSADRARNER